MRIPVQYELRSGLSANLPASAPVGEPLWTTDTHKLYVGTGTGLVQVAGGGTGGGVFTHALDGSNDYTVLPSDFTVNTTFEFTGIGGVRVTFPSTDRGPFVVINNTDDDVLFTNETGASVSWTIGAGGAGLFGIDSGGHSIMFTPALQLNGAGNYGKFNLRNSASIVWNDNGSGDVAGSVVFPTPAVQPAFYRNFILDADISATVIMKATIVDGSGQHVAAAGPGDTPFCVCTGGTAGQSVACIILGNASISQGSPSGTIVAGTYIVPTTNGKAAAAGPGSQFVIGQALTDPSSGTVFVSVNPRLVTVPPVTIAKVASQWLDSYDAATGLFTKSQPAYSDLSSGLLLQVDGVDNGDQNVLNLTGSGFIDIVDDGSGGVTFSLNQTLASSKPAVANRFLNSYDASTGLFTAAQPSYSDLSGSPVAGGSTTQVQYNASGILAGNAAFLFDYTNVIVQVGPLVSAISPVDLVTPVLVPRLQFAGAAEVQFFSKGSLAGSAGILYQDIPTSASLFNSYGLAVARLLNPNSASTAYFTGASLAFGVDIDNVQNLSGMQCSVLDISANWQAATHLGTCDAIFVEFGSSTKAGGTQTIDNARGVYVESLFGDGTATAATYNITKVVGLNVGGVGFLGAGAAGTIATSWGINIEGPRLQGTGSFTTRKAIRIADQIQGNPSGRNADAWGIYEEGALERNRLGKIALVTGLIDPTDTTKIAHLDVSAIATGTTRQVVIPNANSVTVVPDTGAANNFLTAISAAGVISKAQPAFSNLSGSITLAQTALTTLGDILYVNATPALARLAGNITAVKQFLNQTGNGSISAAPTWAALVAGDIPSLPASQITSGALALARGGTGVDLSASGAATFVLAQDAAHVISARALVAADIPSLAASKITSGQLALAQGGTGVDLSATGAATFVLAQDAAHVISARALVAGDLPNHSAALITSGTLALARGGTNADLSGTGGANQFLKQTSVGGAVTVAAIVAADIAAGVVTWDKLGAAAADLTLANAGFNTTINQTSATTLKLANTTAATSSVSQSSPFIKLAGRYWSGSDTEDSWTIQDVVANGTNGTSILDLVHAGTSGNAFVRIPAGTLASASAWGLNFTGTTVGLAASGSVIALVTTNTYPTIRFYNGATLKAALSTFTSSSIDAVSLVNSAATACITVESNLSTTLTQAGITLVNVSSFAGTGAGTQYGVAIGNPTAGTVTNGTLTFAPASGATDFVACLIRPVINQTGSSSGNYTGLRIVAVETALKGSANKLVDLFAGSTGTTEVFSIDNAGVETSYTPNGAQWIYGSASELLTLSTAGLTTDTTANLLPANAIIEAVVCRVTTTITTTTNWAVGDASVSSRFASANATLTAGTTMVGLNHQKGGVAADANGPTQTAAAKVRITCTGSNPGAGAIRITVFYRQFVAPTS